MTGGLRSFNDSTSKRVLDLLETKNWDQVTTLASAVLEIRLLNTKI